MINHPSSLISHIQIWKGISIHFSSFLTFYSLRERVHGPMCACAGGRAKRERERESKAGSILHTEHLQRSYSGSYTSLNKFQRTHIKVCSLTTKNLDAIFQNRLLKKKFKHKVMEKDLEESTPGCININYLMEMKMIEVWGQSLKLFKYTFALFH